VPRCDIGRETWNAFVDRSDDAWLWHRFEFQEAIATWAGRQDLSFAVVTGGGGGDLLAIVPAQSVRGRWSGRMGLQQLESMGFVACSPELSAKQRHTVSEIAVAKLMDVADRIRACGLEANLWPTTPALQGDRLPRVNPLVQHGFENTATQTWLLDLRPPIDTIRRGYSELARREIRKARAAEGRIREARGDQDLETYYALHRQTYARSGAAPHPREYFSAIFRDFVERGISRVLFYEEDGRVLAAQNTAIYKGAALYWTGASVRERAGANRLLFDEQIAYAREVGCRWYDVGEAFPAATGKLRGLSDFKRSFGGELYPIYRGRRVLRPAASAVLGWFRSRRA
jgi:hypothetical protein